MVHFFFEHMNQNVFSGGLYGFAAVVISRVGFAQLCYGQRIQVVARLFFHLLHESSDFIEQFVLVELLVGMEIFFLEETQPVIHNVQRVDKDVSNGMEACFPVFRELFPRQLGAAVKVLASYCLGVLEEFANINHAKTMNLLPCVTVPDESSYALVCSLRS